MTAGPITALGERCATAAGEGARNGATADAGLRIAEPGAAHARARHSAAHVHAAHMHAATTRVHSATAAVSAARLCHGRSYRRQRQ
jgi:hypothetical protein